MRMLGRRLIPSIEVMLSLFLVLHSVYIHRSFTISLSNPNLHTLFTFYLLVLDASQRNSLFLSCLILAFAYDPDDHYLISHSHCSRSFCPTSPNVKHNTLVYVFCLCTILLASKTDNHIISNSRLVLSAFSSLTFIVFHTLHFKYRFHNRITSSIQ